jgi:PAS domain S-box-containing protein
MAFARYAANVADADQLVSHRETSGRRDAVTLPSNAGRNGRFHRIGGSAFLILAACLLVLVSAAISIRGAWNLHRAVAGIAQEDDTSVTLRRLRAEAAELAGDHRAFLLTGEPRFRVRYLDTARSLPALFARLGARTTGLPRARPVLDLAARTLARDARAMDEWDKRAGAAASLAIQELLETELLFQTVQAALDDAQQQVHEHQASRIGATLRESDGAVGIALSHTLLECALIGGLLYVLRRNARTLDRVGSDRAAALAAAAANADQQNAERLHIEAALRHRDTLLRGLSDAIPQIVFLIYPDGSGEFINRRWNEFTGAAAIFAQTQEWDQLVHPDDVKRLRTRWHQAFHLSAPLMAEFRLRSKDGQYLWFLAQAMPVADPDTGDVEHWVGTFTDIDHLHRADAARRESEEHFRRIFEGSPLGMTLSEGSGERRIIQANPEFCRMLGYGPDELIGHSLHDLTDPRDRDVDHPAASLARSTRGWIEREKRYVTRQGSVVWARIRVGVFDMPAGTEPQLLAVVQDITRQREVDETLRQAHRMEAVGQLSGGLAHDFNNLLGVIIGNVECLLDTLPPDHANADLAREVLESALSGAELTRRLLAFGRRQSLAPQNIDLRQQVARHVSLLSRTLGRTIRVETVFADDLWLTCADLSQIGDALLNLAINARDAMPYGGVLTIETYNDRVDTVKAAYSTEVMPGDYVVLAVSDTGVGMPPEVCARAVEPFFTTKPPGSGSGLGLSMIYGFVQQSGGHLTIASEVGVGTTIRIYLPRVIGVADPTPSDTPEQTLPTGTETILVVDDSSEMRQVAERHLRSLGYTVLCAANGPAALAQLHAGVHVDLLFTDIAMPEGLSGFELVEAAHRLFPDLPVLFTTGYAGTGGAAAMPDWQARLIRKPYRRHELAEKVRASLSRRPARPGHDAIRIGVIRKSDETAGGAAADMASADPAPARPL